MNTELENLFINNSIEVLQELLRKRRSEVEKKKDELRSLVGERHRDVIEASDTIQAMKDLSSTVANATRTLANHYSRLTASFSSDYDETSSKCSADFLIAAHVKSLLDIPELIWNHMDSGDHTSAAILFFLGRHVSARLHLSSELLSSDVDVHVLVKRLWNSLAQMEVAVLSACRRRLSAPPSTSQELCNSLTALLLLENTSLDQALTEYLRGRKVALEQILGTSHTETLELDGGSTSGAPPLPLKKQLALVGKFLMSALETTEYLFLDDGVGTISPAERLGALRRGFLKLQEWKLKGATWLVGDRLYSHLPPEVINFRLFSATCGASRSVSSSEGPAMDLPLSLLEERVYAWWSESLVLCRSTITKSMSHAPNLNSLVSIRASILPMITNWQKQGSCPARASSTTNSGIGSSRNGCPPDLSSADFTIGHPHIGESILHREVDLWSELFAEPFLTHIAQLVETKIHDFWCRWTSEVESLLSQHSGWGQTELSSEKSNPQRQISSELSFVWSDIKPDVLLTEQLSYPTRIGSTKGCKKRNDVGTKSENGQGLHPAATNLTRFLRPENIGLIVFCYLTDRSIPDAVCVPHDQSETVCAPPPHLLVFLQRLVFDNSSPSTIDLPLPSPLYTSSSSGNRRSPDTNQLASRLSLLPSSLQNVCQTFDESIAELVLTVAQSAHQDWLPLWEILVSTLKRAIQRCEDWLLTTAYKRSNSDGNFCEQLAVDPMSGLLLARACQALISLCPSIGATIVAGTGVIESATTKPSVGTSDVCKDKDKNGIAKRGFSWADLSHLRSVWSSVCAPLLETADRLTLDCLCHATLGTSTADTFFQRMVTVISPTSNESVACETDQLNYHTILRLLIEYGEFDSLSDVVTPFDDIRLETGSAEGETDENAVAILRVPSSVSLPLHQLLLSTVRTIGQLLVHKVPVPSLNREICLRIGASLLDTYVKLVEHLPSISSSKSIEESSGPLTNGKDLVVDSCLSSVVQPIALQLIFDIRYLMQLLVWPTTQSGIPRSRLVEESATSKELASTVRRKSGDLLSKLEAYVDPFDWEMCHQRLSTSITHALNTTSHLYVPLIQPGLAGHVDNAKYSAEKSRASGLEVASLLPLITTEPVKDKERATASFSTLQLTLSSCVDKRRSKLGVHGTPKSMQQHFR
ncbi:Golgi transport complex subunit 1 [Clonorchis sinensis]|uniref:Conserved oligomeric Golgi complex subunit 1 n=1 Tax=Clonorchis sinensis TaxID=79923 RepID=A0A8T1M3N6_CLOSI|nr:Golgi transport complex subunit 1 [Clonorchis sinensis]